LDKIIDFTVADYCLSSERSQRLKEIVAFYRTRVDQGLNALENTVVTEGVHVFKFYSSSIILKSAEGTVALDFAQGPVGNDYKQGSVGNEGEPETSDYFKTGFYLTPEQRDRLARLVDVYLITHPHQDHADYSLAMRMIKAGKPVIGPEQLKYKWEDLSQGITVPNYETVQKFHPCEIFTQFGYQYSESKPVADGIRMAVPTYYLSRDVESIRYLVKIGGLVFHQAAETHTEGYEWLEKAGNFGWSVDVLLTAGAHQGYRSVMKFFADKKINYFSLPIHEYEITHPNGGRRAAPFLKGNNRKAFDQKRLMALLWGEDFLLTRKMINVK
jgi:L-ascorbate metabolism protein UlaG (beta-lactamase superfamily)